MEQVLLDSNFIITCVRQKIDFFEKIDDFGFEILVPEQVIKEIEKLSKAEGKSLKLRNQAELSLKILNANKFRKIKLKTRNVDNAIKKFADSNPRAIIATLDRELKKRTANRKMVIREKRKLQVI